MRYPTHSPSHPLITPHCRRHFLDTGLDGGISGESGSASSVALAKSPSKRLAPGPGKKGKKTGGSAGDVAVDAEEEVQEATRLLAQPSNILNVEMRDYQLEGLNWLIGLHANGMNGILADEMGLGKTLQTISLLAWMKQNSESVALEEGKSQTKGSSVSPTSLVLVPKSTLSNWEKEIARFCPSLRSCVLIGDREARETIIEKHLRPGMTREDRGWDVLVTTYEMANVECKVLEKIPWMYIIVDEAHRLKNENSSLATIVRGFNTAHRLLITGTPLQNNLHELWALLNFLLPDVFSDSAVFDSWFARAAESNDEAAKAKMVGQLHRVLRPFMLRRLKCDVAKGLPPKKETLLYIKMTSMQRDLYKSILMRDLDAVLAEKGPGQDKTRLSNIIMHLRKACNHPYLFEGLEDRNLDPMGDHLWKNCAKMRLLDALLPKLKARGSRVLIFTQFTSLLDILEDYCNARQHPYCRIDGQTAYEDREANIERYNAPGSEKFIFMLSTRAGGLGINLATADVVILYDSDWNPQADLQAQDRAHRIGQTKPVSVYRLVTEGTVEEQIIERALLKLKLDAVVVQQGRLASASKGLSKDELTSMVQFGADAVFRSGKAGDTEMTEADIDAILEAGEAKTRSLTDKISEKVQAAGGGGGSWTLNWMAPPQAVPKCLRVWTTPQRLARMPSRQRR